MDMNGLKKKRGRPKKAMNGLPYQLVKNIIGEGSDMEELKPKEKMKRGVKSMPLKKKVGKMTAQEKVNQKEAMRKKGYEKIKGMAKRKNGKP